MRTPWLSPVVACFILVGSLSILGLWLVRPPQEHSPLVDLAEAIGSHHDLDVRLTGGFRPHGQTTVTRSATSTTDRLPPDARIAIARLEKQAAREQSPRALSALGVAYIIGGDVDRAITTLEDATALAADAAPWSDLSAAYLVKASRTPARRIEYLARALDAAARSLRITPTGEARFNRAAALQALAPYVGGPGPWDDYLRTEHEPLWAAEARRRVSVPAPAPDERASWDERRKVVSAHLDAHDAAFIIETVTRFPEASLEFFEQLLTEWAQATTSADSRTAMASLNRAEQLAESWSTATRDSMLREIVQRMRSLSASTVSSQSLARAHLAYRDAVSQYRADDYSGAAASLDSALAAFTRAKTPFWTWAALQKAVVLFQQRELDSADAELAPIEALARRRGYQTLLGRALRQRGLTQSKQWRLAEALGAFQEAARCFEAVGEHEDAAAVYSLIAANLRMLGEHHQSWEYIGRTLDGLGHMRTPLRRYLVLYNASLFASSQELYEGALLFQEAALREARLRGGGPVIEALTERATIHARRGEQEQALRDLREGLSIVDQVPDGAPKRAARAETQILIAELNERGQRPLNIEGLPDAVKFFSKQEPAFVPRLYLGLARAQLASGSADAAEAAFTAGVTQLEEQHSRLGDEAFKISYFDESWNLFPEMVAFQLDVRRDTTKAFEFAERSRARSLSSKLPVRLFEIRERIPPSVAVIYYVTLPDRLLIWTITSTGFGMTESRTRRADLARLVSRYVARIREERPASSAVDVQLYESLIRPVAAAVADRATLVFVPDADLQRMPFATLRNPKTGRYLVDDHAILATPSATVFVSGLTRLREWSHQRLESALLVGNPVTADPASSALRPLPGAEAEAVAAAAFYTRHEILTGRAATKARFVESAGGYDVVHFGGHALVNTEYPLLSRLAFSPDRDGAPPQSLFAHEISHLPLRNTRLVVLAACSTAVGAVSRGEGVVSVARPFLAAGVPMVVASQWDVDDRATARLFVEFHRALSKSADPVQALRSAQLTLLRSGDDTLASPRSWGAFVVLGTTAQ